MNPFIGYFVRILALVALFMLGVAHPIIAATFDVTSSSFNDSNGFRAALMKANSNSGPDIIDIKVPIISWDPLEFGHSIGADYSVSVTVTDALTINGNGAKIVGENNWLDNFGQLNRFNETDGCPNKIKDSIIIGMSGGFLQIGQYNNDNSGVNVTVNDLTIEKLSSISKIRQNASLTLHNVQAKEIRNLFRCNASLVSADEGASFIMDGGGFTSSQVFYSFTPRYLINGGIPTSTGAAKLILKNVNFELNKAGYSVGWNGGGAAEITSSRFSDSGGFEFSGGTVKITNSLLYHPGKQFFWDSLRIWRGTVDIVASTFVLGMFDCDFNYSPCFDTWLPPDFEILLAPVQAGPGGVMNFSQSIVAVQWIQDLGSKQTKLMETFNGGRITADDRTFIQPLPLQSATELKTLTGQPNLITDPPGLHVYTNFAEFDSTYNQIGDFVPQLGTVVAPSKLIDAIPSAQQGGTNQLLAPDGSFITTDVLGHPRVDSNNRRNIGALQTALAPVLVITPSDAHVEAKWTRVTEPLVDSIKNYQLCYHTSTLDPISSNCPGTLQDTSDAITFHADINGLINGTRYWFMVRAVTVSGSSGPWSIVTDAIPAAVPGVPVPTASYGDGLVNLAWTVPASNGSALTNYVVKYRPQGSSTWTPWVFSGTTTSTKINNLTNGTIYEFEVAAVNGIGQGVFGKTISTPAKMLSLAYPTPIEADEGYNQTIQPALANLLGIPTYSIISGSLPAGMSLNPSTGIISGIPLNGSGSASGIAYPVTIKISQSGPPALTSTATLTINVFKSLPSLQLIYPDLLGVYVGSGPYTLIPSTTGFSGPISYSIIDGSLPPGLSLDPNTGIISGTPTTSTSGMFIPTIRASAQNGNEIRQNVLEIEILPLLSYPDANPTLGTPFTLTPIVSPSVSPGKFSIIGGVLPSGLTLNPDTGIISGTPSQAVSEQVIIKYVTGFQTVTANLLITVSSYSISLSYPVTNTNLGQNLNIMPTINGTIGSKIYSLDGGQLPTGLALNPSTGMIYGVATGAVGSFAVRINVTDQYTSTSNLVVIKVQTPIYSTPNSIPTLSDYALILLSSLLIVVAIWKKRHQI